MDWKQTAYAKKAIARFVLFGPDAQGMMAKITEKGH